MDMSPGCLLSLFKVGWVCWYGLTRVWKTSIKMESYSVPHDQFLWIWKNSEEMKRVLPSLLRSILAKFPCFTHRVWEITQQAISNPGSLLSTHLHWRMTTLLFLGSLPFSRNLNLREYFCQIKALQLLYFCQEVSITWGWSGGWNG